MSQSIEHFLIHALAGLGEKKGAEEQEDLWNQGDAAQREDVLLARARHTHSRIPGLQAALADKHAEVRLRALKLLLDGPYHPELTDAVAHCLEKDRSKALREQAFELVTVLPPDERFLPGLTAFLAHKNATMRERASYHIRRTASQNEELLRPVLAMLSNPNASTRYLALKALHYPHTLFAVFSALCDRLEYTTDPASREALGQAFGYYQDGESVRDELFVIWDDTMDEMAVRVAFAMAYARVPALEYFLEQIYWSGDEDGAEATILGLELLEATHMADAFRAQLDGNPLPPPQNRYQNEEPDNEY